MDGSSQQAAWLVRASGPNVGKRHILRGSVTIGRDPHCDLNPPDDESDFVSSRHAEICLTGVGDFEITDLDSTNGTFVDGERVKRTRLRPGSVIRFGASGPEYRFELLEAGAPGDTMVAPVVKPEVEQDPASGTHKEQLLNEAVGQARRARQAGFGGQTTMIMCSMLDAAVHRSSRKQKRVIWVLLAALVLVLGFSAWRIRALEHQRRGIDQRILEIESQIEQGGLDETELDALLRMLRDYEGQAAKLRESVFYRLGFEGREDAFIEREIRALMAEFGAEEYSIPPEFMTQTRLYVDRFRTVDRGLVERALGSRRGDLERMRAIFSEMKLPPDLVYMVLVESSFITQRRSAKGAAGLWQFTPATARAYGLKVGDGVDERFDLEKSTRAAGRYVRELILDFGAGSSVMLALAAYNVGPGKVKRAVRKIRDPIRQRNFWYLYRSRALPRETREYVPKIIAGIIVGRNLDQLGF